MMKLIVSFFCGLLFGIGLYISQMVNPTKVINFLDLAGNWDPSLLFVMGAGVFVFALGYFFIIKKRTQPILGEHFFISSQKLIDKNLIMGAIFFGAGWGLTGICPGPAIAKTLTFEPKIIVFIGMMLIGMFSARLLLKNKTSAKVESVPSTIQAVESD